MMHLHESGLSYNLDQTYAIPILKSWGINLDLFMQILTELQLILHWVVVRVFLTTKPCFDVKRMYCWYARKTCIARNYSDFINYHQTLYLQWNIVPECCKVVVESRFHSKGKAWLRKLNHTRCMCMFLPVCIWPSFCMYGVDTN